jgi:hypothetical protein
MPSIQPARKVFSILFALYRQDLDLYFARTEAWTPSLSKKLFPYRATIEKDEGEEEQDGYDEDIEDGYDENEYEGWGFNHSSYKGYVSASRKFWQDHYVRDHYKTYDDEKDKLKSFIVILLFLEYLAFLLRKILQYLLLFCGFAEFPNRRRPKCTTMPWTIWPSLVVLWGVCWMFNPRSSPPAGAQNQILNNEDLQLWDPSKTPSYTIESLAKLTFTLQTD